MKRLFILCAMILFLPFVVSAGTLPDTGQTKCYDNSSEITCPNRGEAFYGQDAQFPCNPQSYTKLDDNGNELPESAPEWVMVRDNITGLIWENKTDDGSIHDRDDTYTWYNAQDVFIPTLNSQNFGGHSDWHLPTVKELSGLLDVSIPSPGPTISVDYFPNTAQNAYYWSSTAYADIPNCAWVVDFFDCYVGYAHPSRYPFSVRAVREEQTSNNFVDNLDGTVTDTDTGLMWQKDTALGTYTWQQALSYCESLTLAVYNDWRLPNRNELQSIVDYNHHPVSIDPIFPNTESSYYWSSTTHATYPFYAWVFNFDSGAGVHRDKSLHYSYIRAVRAGKCDFDGDEDEIPDNQDNCPNTPNTNQLDSYPPGSNGIGDACDCEGDFACDGDVDGSDASTFKADFGRSVIVHPCIAGDTCNGDFNCDGDADGTDAALFKADFGRSSLQKPCPVCVAADWCSYPLP
jgi:hypothetical protein